VTPQPPEPGGRLGPLPARFAATRDGLRALACFAISPARKARTGRIGLRATGDGFGTPPFDDGTRIVVRGRRLAWEPGASTAITTVRAAAEFLAAELSPDPGVGEDLPPFEPDTDLAVDDASSLALGAWYAFGQALIDARPEAKTEAQLWPEHFDLATTVELAGGTKVNVGFSPGDGFNAEPYAYVGPHDLERLTRRAGDGWNAPFGAYLAYGELLAAADPAVAAQAFISERLARLR
jgi:hypothetical protein